MSLDDQLRSGSLEAHAALDADDSVAHVAVAAYGVGCAYLLNLLNCSHFVGELFAVDGLYLSVLEGYLERCLGLLGSDVLQISLLGQSLCRIEKLSAADAGSPDAHVVGVFQLGEVGKVAVLVQIVDLFLACELLVARESDDFHSRSHDEEGHVEAYLVVARSRRAVGYGIGTNLVGISCYGDGLEDALRAYADGVAVVAQHVAEYHVAQRLFVVFVGDVERYVLFSAQLVGVFFVCLELFGAEASGICTRGIHLVSFFCQAHHGVGCVEAA